LTAHGKNRKLRTSADLTSACGALKTFQLKRVQTRFGASWTGFVFLTQAKQLIAPRRQGAKEYRQIQLIGLSPIW
jgi:hypothetical protein